MIDYRLYLVTDDPSRYRGDWLENVVAAVEGGVTAVQYRDTESAPPERLERARALQDALRGRAALIINNEPELAAALGADGVHVGQGDRPPSEVRRIVGARCEIGYSITDIGQLESRCGEIAASDALGIGPVFDARKTKADAAPEMGLAGFGRIVASLGEAERRRLGVVAIGGITRGNAAGVLAAGADGLALVSAFSMAADPFAAARELKRLTASVQQQGITS